MIDYKNTLNLPDTQKFLMRANLSLKEPIILKFWYEDNLYEMIRRKKKNKKLFLLHDGPIYANGSIHLGHAVNKILKDIVLKFKGLMNYNAPYIPGWDCHGLPIELQVERLIRKTSSSMDPKEFRSICRNYVLEQIEIQKKDFIRLGILGNWENPYLTMDFKTEANIIRTLSKIISNNYLYKGTKPVYWCFQCCSVLAESEVEYNNNHFSFAIDVAFPAVDSMRLAEVFNVDLCNQIIELVIWTTTPWTLPVNQAISVHPHHNYQLVKIKNNNYGTRYIIIASNMVDVVMKRISCFCWKILGETTGSTLEFVRFHHPFMSFDVPIVLSCHVSCDTGTGIVHIAPNHGIDDYFVAKKYNFKIVDLINDKGCYALNDYSVLNGVCVLQSNEIIIDLLRKSGTLLHLDAAYQHSYPYCWRHATPVIFRVTSQWFLSMDKHDLRNKLLKTIRKVHWIPNKSQFSIKTLIVNRPDWCLSRQRIWGVPIPLFFNKKTKILHPRTCELIEIIAQSIEKYGVQAWWDLKIEDIIGRDDSAQYEKALDTLDVWFDSGSTHDSVIPERSEYLQKLPDLYLEGADQHRGWFMSSLVISTAISGIAPYKEVLSHGFTVDADGRKMSKSIGNIISPQEIINSFGADILRLWVASSDYSKDMVISDSVLKNVTDMYRRIRNTARFCLTNLYDFNPVKNSIASDSMVALDRWAVHRALSVQLKIISDYNKYNFHNVTQRIMQFCSVDMGSFYLDIIKDRQYTTKKNSVLRRSCQTALYHIIEAMVRWIAPILSFTADEIWRCIPGNRSKYVFTEEWYDGLFSIDSEEIINDNYWNVFFNIRNAVNRSIEKSRMSGIIRGSLEASVVLYASSELAKYLRVMQDELSFGLLISSVIILDYCEIDSKIQIQEEMPGLKIVLKKAEGKKCLRCWHYRTDLNKNTSYVDICKRCISNMVGQGENRRFF